jgi:hypothetical protein
MKSTVSLALLLVVTLASSSGSARQGQLNPQASQNGPLDVKVVDGSVKLQGTVELQANTSIDVNPGKNWPAVNRIPAVWVAGGPPPQWAYDSVCIGGAPDRWTELTRKGQDGWELVGSAGASCTQGGATGTWFILKKPVR